MPIYEYRCKKCGKQFEYMQRMSDAAKRKCEACGALALERLISSTSFQLKGSGWYKDLYSSAKPAASGSTESASGSESGSDSKPAETKPAASEKSGSTGDKKTPKKKGSA